MLEIFESTNARYRCSRLGYSCIGYNICAVVPNPSAFPCVPPASVVTSIGDVIRLIARIALLFLSETYKNLFAYAIATGVLNRASVPAASV